MWNKNCNDKGKMKVKKRAKNHAVHVVDSIALTLKQVVSASKCSVSS